MEENACEKPECEGPLRIESVKIFGSSRLYQIGRRMPGVADISLAAVVRDIQVKGDTITVVLYEEQSDTEFREVLKHCPVVMTVRTEKDIERRRVRRLGPLNAYRTSASKHPGVLVVEGKDEPTLRCKTCGYEWPEYKRPTCLRCEVVEVAMAGSVDDAQLRLHPRQADTPTSSTGTGRGGGQMKGSNHGTCGF